jgi:hypothetical protein
MIAKLKKGASDMPKWIDDYEAAYMLGMNRNTFRRLIRSSDNPPRSCDLRRAPSYLMRICSANGRPDGCSQRRLNSYCTMPITAVWMN